MKRLIRLIRLAGIVWALTLTQASQATYMRGNDREPLYSTSSVFAKPNPFEIANDRPATVSAPARNLSLAKIVTPVLSSLSLQQNRDRGTEYVRHYGYTPESLVQNITPKSPTGSVVTRKPLPAGSPASVADGGATTSLLGMALLGTALMKRKFAA
jgi:hypothetical protein